MPSGTSTTRWPTPTLASTSTRSPAGMSTAWQVERALADADLVAVRRASSTAGGCPALLADGTVEGDVDHGGDRRARRPRTGAGRISTRLPPTNGPRTKPMPMMSRPPASPVSTVDIREDRRPRPRRAARRRRSGRASRRRRRRGRERCGGAGGIGRRAAACPTARAAVVAVAAPVPSSLGGGATVVSSTVPAGSSRGSSSAGARSVASSVAGVRGRVDVGRLPAPVAHAAGGGIGVDGGRRDGGPWSSSASSVPAQQEPGAERHQPDREEPVPGGRPPVAPEHADARTISTMPKTWVPRSLRSIGGLGRAVDGGPVGRRARRSTPARRRRRPGR